jgi:hypothetical protein
VSNIYNLYNSTIPDQMSTEKTQAEKDISYTGEEGTKHEKTEMLIGAEATTKRVWEIFLKCF